MKDMTVAEILADPMIRLLMRADKVSVGSLTQLMERTAKERDLKQSASVTADMAAAAFARNPDVCCLGNA